MISVFNESNSYNFHARSFVKTDLNLGSDTMNVSGLKKVYPHLAPVPSLTYQYSDVEMILGQDCFHASRPVKIHGDESRNSPFAVRLPIGWVLSGPLPSSLGLPSHCFKCSVEDNSLMSKSKVGMNLSPTVLINQPIRVQLQTNKL